MEETDETNEIDENNELDETNDLDECSNNPCENGATCKNTEGGFKCKCLEGWEGDTCAGNFVCVF